MLWQKPTNIFPEILLKEAIINFQSTWWDTLFKHLHSWLHAITIVRTSFRTNLRAIVCLNVKEFLTQSKRHIWDLSDSNRFRNHNYSVRKKTLNHSAKLAKWLSCVVSAYLHGAFDCMLLLCHAQVSEWIYTL